MNTALTYVRFEYGQEDRISDVLGPFEFVQLTYSDLRVQVSGEDTDRTLACYHEGLWKRTDDDTKWSDVVIFGETEDK